MTRKRLVVIDSMTKRVRPAGEQYVAISPTWLIHWRVSAAELINRIYDVINGFSPRLISGCDGVPARDKLPNPLLILPRIVPRRDNLWGGRLQPAHDVICGQ